MHPLMKGTQVCSNEEPLNSHKVNEFFLLLINILIIICVYWFSRSFFFRWVLWLMGLLSIYTWPKEIKLRHQNMIWNSLQIGKILSCWRMLLLGGVEGGHLLIILYEIVTFNAKNFLITSWFLRKKFPDFLIFWTDNIIKYDWTHCSFVSQQFFVLVEGSLRN